MYIGTTKKQKFNNSNMAFYRSYVKGSSTKQKIAALLSFASTSAP